MAAFLIHSSVIFSQWETDVVYSSNYYFENVCTVDRFRAWAIGSYGFSQDTSVLLIRTAESPWFQHYLDIANNNDFTCVYSNDSDKAWIGTADGKVYYISYNQNQVVLQINSGGLGFINDIEFSRTNPNYGYVFCDPPNGAGTPFKIYKTTNKGINWTALSPVFGGTYVGSALSMCVTDSNHVWLGLNCQQTLCQTPKVAYTTNGGLNWQLSSVPNGSNYISSVTFKYDNSYGIVAPWDQVPTYLYRSFNGGSSWLFLLNTTLMQPVYSLNWIPGSTTWYHCVNDDSRKIQKSTNDGINWFPMTYPNGIYQLESMDLIREGNKVFGYGVASNGVILKLEDSITVIGIQNINSSLPDKYFLYQNYPNPFNPVTNIKFDIPKAGNVSLKVFDITGKQVAELVNENMQAGSYNYDFDAAGLASGVYYYRLTSGSYTNIKKMILVK